LADEAMAATKASLCALEYFRHSEKFRNFRPRSTSRATIHDIGEIREYHGHTVFQEWQSRQLLSTMRSTVSGAFAPASTWPTLVRDTDTGCTNCALAKTNTTTEAAFQYILDIRYQLRFRMLTIERFENRSSNRIIR
jgi:hypothetical protein